MINIILISSSAFLAALMIILSIFVKPKKTILKFNARTDENDKMFYIIAKISSIIMFVLFIYRILNPEVFEQIVNQNGLFKPDTVVLMAIVRALFCGASFMVIMSAWFNYRPLQNAVAVFSTISYILNLIFFKQNIQSLLGLVKVPTYSIREIAFACELVLGLSTSILYLFKRIKDKDYKNVLLQAVTTPLIFGFFSLYVMNPYTYENISDLETWDEIAIDFNQAHILLIVGMIVVTILLAILFRNVKDKNKLYCFLSCMAVGCLINYIYGRDYAHFYYWKLPLHICNTGVFLMFISFTIKSKPIFYFNYLVNIAGALFAIFMPDDEFYIMSQEGLHFWVNHIVLFILPVVAVAGGFYPRPKFKYAIAAIGVFTIYFLTVAFLDAIWQDQVNYFFLNGDSIVEKFSWSPPLKYNYILTFEWAGLNFRVYWLYWILVYVVYIGFIFVAWFCFATLYQVSDGYADLFNRNIKYSKQQSRLRKEMGGRSLKEPLHPENVGKVIISHFSKIYNGTTTKAVDDFSLEIKPGQVYGFLGHNGAGKSTTIKSLVGIQTITEGTIEINGYDLVRQPLEAKMNVGYVSDNHTVYDHLTGREYINYVADLYLVSEKDRDERIAKYVKMFKLEDAIDREIKGYSHGMKQKIVVIGSLIHNPKVWVLDEPLTGLDPTSSYQIKTIMKEYAEEGNIVFFSSHVIEVVEKICDEICIIGQGKLIGKWKIKDLAKQGLTLSDLYKKYVSYNSVTDLGGIKNAE